MGNILLTIFIGIFGAINNLFIAPLVSGVIALFPDLATYVNYFIDFIELAATYLTTLLRLLLFTRSMFVLLFAYFMIKWTVWVASCIIRASIKIYNSIKP